MLFIHLKQWIARLVMILSIVAGLFGVTLVHSASANTSIVWNTNDSGAGSLRQAILDTDSGDTIVFDISLAGDSIFLHSQLTINKNLTLDGSALNPPLTLRAGNAARIMQVDYPADVTISGLILSGGTVNGNGGAVYASGSFTAINSTFLNNRAAYGGALWGGPIRVINSTFSGNQAVLDGGAITSVSLHIENSTIVGNQADNDGGAISIWGDGGLRIVNSTILQNQAGNRGGGMFLTGYPTVNIYNSTFAENTALSGHEFSLGTIYQIALKNTIFVCNGESDACYVTAGKPILNTNSILGIGTIQDYGLTVLADNGGSTETMALMHNSSLVDAGDDETCASEPVNGLDQRAAPRPQGSHCDIGAYEHGSSPPTSTPTLSYTPSTSTSTSTSYSPSTSTPTGTQMNVSTSTPTGTPTGTPTNTSTSTITPTLTPSRTPTVSGTSTTTGTPISNCGSVFHGTLTLYENSMSLSITNQTGIPLAVQEVFVNWDHDRGHQEGNDKTLILQQASLNGTPFWTGNAQGPSITIVPSNVFIPLGNSTIQFIFHQTYDRSDSSEELFISLGTNGCQNYPIHSSEAVTVEDIGVWIGGTQMGDHLVAQGQALRVSYPVINNGPVKLMSINMRSIVGSEAAIYKVNGVNTSFSEMMGLPASQLDTTYWLPWYNNVDLDTQLRIANVSTSPAMVHVSIGGVLMTGSPFTLAPGESTRKSFPNINSGPVKIESDQTIVVAERVIYKVNHVHTSFSEMMALPQSQLDTVYWLPWYNNVDLDTQLRIANVSNSPATVIVTIGGVPQPSFNLAADESVRKSFAGINNGPVKIESDHGVPIVAAERVIYKVKGVPTSFSEMMALPDSQLNTTFWFPWYNNLNLDTQLRIGNVSGSQATITVTIGGVPQPSFNLAAGKSTRISFTAVNNGPVKIESTQSIVAAERVIYKINGTPTSFSEMMGIPSHLLDATFWFPWYNNVNLETQLRFGVR